MEYFTTKPAATATIPTYIIQDNNIAVKQEIIENEEVINIESDNDSESLKFFRSSNITTIEETSVLNHQVSEVTKPTHQKLCGLARKRLKKIIAYGVPYEEALAILNERYEEKKFQHLSDVAPVSMKRADMPQNLATECTVKEEFDIASHDETDYARSSKSTNATHPENIENDKVTEVIQPKRRRLCGAVKQRLKKMIKTGIPYEKARAIIDKQYQKKLQNVGDLAPVLIKKDESNTPSLTVQSTILQQPKINPMLDSLQVGIVPRHYPECSLTEEQGKKIQSAVLKALERVPLGQQIKFMGSSRQPGWVKITCADKISRDWLKHTVGMLTPYEGADLKIIEGLDVPKYVVCTGFFPDDENIHEDKILCRLSSQNKGLYTQNWRVLNKVTKKKGQHLVMSIDNISARSLKTINYKPFYGFGKVTLQLKPKRKQDYHRLPINSSVFDIQPSTTKANDKYNSMSSLTDDQYERKRKRNWNNKYENPVWSQSERSGRSEFEKEGSTGCIIVDHRQRNRRYEGSPETRFKEEYRRHPSKRK